MKRHLLALALLLVGGAGLNAQTVTVTGHMKSGNTSNVTSKAFMRFRLRNFSGNTPRVTSTGAIVQTQFDVAPDNTGTVTTTIYANDFISPVNTFWTVETWYNGVFQFSYNYGICASTQVTYCSTVGATFNLDSASPISFPTPPAPYLPLPGPTGPTGPQGPIGPQGPPGAGGSGPTLQTNNGTNASQTLLNLLNGSNVTMTNSGGGVTVNATPSGSSSQLQYDNSGAFGGASGITTPDGNSLSVKGVAPWSDITAFGAHAGVAITTATCSTLTPQVTLGVSGFINGDGVTLQGCGASVSISTPSAPTLTPMFAGGPTRDHITVSGGTGSSTYIACIVAEDANQGLTPCSSTTTINNGPSTIGGKTLTITSQSLSNDVLTTNYSGGVTLANGAMVQVSGAAARFTGEMKITSASAGSYTVSNYIYDSRATPANNADAPNSVTASGTVYYYQGIGITWPNVTNARRYWVCMQRPGDGSLHVIGQSDHQLNSQGWQATAFEDWGSSYLASQSWPYYITDSICTGGGQADSLTTTVVSGGGTSTLTLNVTPNNNTSGTKIQRDLAPALKAAATQAANDQGCVYIPPTTINTGYWLNSYVQLPTSGLCVHQGAPISANDTLEISNTQWYADASGTGTAQFAWTGGPQIACLTANPCIHAVGAGDYITNMSMTYASNAGTGVVVDQAQVHLSNFKCASESSSDFLTMCLQLRNTSGTIQRVLIDNGSTFTSAEPQTLGASWTPLIDMPYGQNGSGSPQNGNIALDIVNSSNSRRGISFVSGDWVSTTGFYTQGPIQPQLFFVPQGGGTFPISMDLPINDTSGEPIIADIGAGAVIFIHKGLNGSNTNPIISGTRPTSALVDGMPVANSNPLPDRHFYGCNLQNAIAAPYDITGTLTNFPQMICQEANVHLMMNGYPLVWPAAPPTGATAGAATAGGSMPSGTFEYAVNATGFDGGESIPSIPSTNTVTTSGTCPGSGNCSNTVTWTGTLGGATYNVWRCNTGAVGGCGAGFYANGSNWLRVATHVSGTSFNDTVNAPSINGFPLVTTTGVSEINALEAEAPQFVCPETTAPSGVAGFDISYCDSTSHQWKDINNNGTAQSRAGFTITPTNTDCVDWSGTGGLLGDTGGKCGHYTITPTNGDCVTWSGTGGLLGDAGAACGTPGGGMDTNMDNMANPTLMNHSLVPANVNTIAVGTQALPFTNAFLGTVANQAGSFDTSALTANHVIKFPNADSTAVQNCASVSHEWISQILQSTGACTQTQPTLADVAAGVAPSGLFDFTNSTMEIPEANGFTATVNSTIGLDTTANAAHLWVNSADSLAATFASAPAGSKCAQTSGTIGQLTEAAAACGTTTPSTTDTFTNKTYNAESTGNALSEPVRAYFGAGGCNNSTASNGFDIGVTNAPTPQCTGSTVRKGVLQFARGNVAYLNFHASSDINLSASVDLEICFTTTDTTNGHVTSFGIQTGFNKTDGTVTDDPTLNAPQALSVTTGASQTSGGELCGKLTGLTTTGAAADYNFEIAITRNNTGTDTNTDTAVAVKSAEVIYGVTKNAANR